MAISEGLRREIDAIVWNDDRPLPRLRPKVVPQVEVYDDNDNDGEWVTVAPGIKSVRRSAAVKHETVRAHLVRLMLASDGPVDQRTLIAECRAAGRQDRRYLADQVSKEMHVLADYGLVVPCDPPPEKADRYANNRAYWRLKR